MIKAAFVDRDSSDKVEFYLPPEKITQRNSLDVEEEKVDKGLYSLKVKGVKVATLTLEDIYFYYNEKDVSSSIEQTVSFFDNRTVLQYHDGIRVYAYLIITSFDITQERRDNNKIKMAKARIELKEIND